jgi:hypothetical protein
LKDTGKNEKGVNDQEDTYIKKNELLDSLDLNVGFEAL